MSSRMGSSFPSSRKLTASARAMTERIKTECKIQPGHTKAVTAIIRDMIRESGDRGTSVLNYLTNLTLLAVLMEDNN